jgi:hypothetical protein
MADNDNNWLNDGNNRNINNNLIDMDDDDDDDDADDMVIHDNDTTLDGGVAVDGSGSGNSSGSSSDCDIVRAETESFVSIANRCFVQSLKFLFFPPQILFIYCKEALDIAPDHPIMRPGTTVSIGLEKQTKLSAVFRRYVDFCNETGGEDSQISLEDLEFIHCQLLNGSDTAETSALMKNDRIQVRKEQKAERDAEAERKRTQREADREYFKQMRNLMSASSKEADVILDCKGKIVDKHGRNQRVLSTAVRANSVIIARRCPWLGNIIQQARIKAREEAREAEENKKDEQDETPEQVASGATEIVDDEDEGIQIEEESRNDERRISNGVDLVVDLDDDENGDDDEESLGSDDASEPGRTEEGTANIVGSSHHHHRVGMESDMLVVTLPNHSPEAVKIILEYCYTNRVLSLGRDAFMLSCKTKPSKHAGPVPPFHSSHHTNKWPNGGIPRVDFLVALAAIKLAEEAGLKRLSLMCEIAAAQLISVCNVTDALVMSSSQKSVSGNDLPRLRKATMEVILRRGQRGVNEVGRSGPFKKALQEQRSIIVPTLFQGTMETVAHWEKAKGAKKVTFDTSNSSFYELDRADALAREKERRKRRRERGASDPGVKRKYDSDNNYSSESLFDDWETEASRRSLKRLRAHNLEIVSRRRTRASTSSVAQRTSQRAARKRRPRG